MPALLVTEVLNSVIEVEEEMKLKIKFAFQDSLKVINNAFYSFSYLTSFSSSGVLALVWQGRPTVNLARPPVCYSCEFTRNINIQLSILWYFIIYF